MARRQSFARAMSDTPSLRAGKRGSKRNFAPPGGHWAFHFTHILRKDSDFEPHAPVPNEQKDPLTGELAARHGAALHRFLASRLSNALTEVPEIGRAHV